MADALVRDAGHELRKASYILEIGCGSGWLLAGLAGRGIEAGHLVGVEIDAKRAAAARRNCPGALVIERSGTQLPLEDASVDVVICASLLSTVDPSQQLALIAEARRVLVADGVLVVYDHRWRRATREPHPITLPQLRKAVGGTVSSRRLGLVAPLRRVHRQWMYRALQTTGLARSHYLALFRSLHPAITVDMRRPESHVVMLIRNSGNFDTRVRKEAGSLTAAGYSVTVLALAERCLPREEILDGVRFLRIAVPRTRLTRHRARFLADQGAAKAAYQQEAADLRQRRQAVSAALREAAAIRSSELTKQMQEIRASGIGVEAAAAIQAARSASRAEAAKVKGLFDADVADLTRQSNRLRERFLSATAQRKARMVRRQRRYLAFRFAYDHVEYHEAVRSHLVVLGPDVIHAHDLNTLYAAWRHARWRRSRLVYDSHELELHRNRQWTRRDRVLSWVIELLGTRRAARTITVCSEIARDLRRAYWIRKPAVVMNAPPLATRGRSVDRDIRALSGVRASDTLVAYVGGVGPNRGLDVLISAMSLLPEHFHLAVLGPRQHHLDQPLTDQAVSVGVSTRVHLLDPVPSTEVPATLRGASLCAVPIQNACRSYDLCMPNKLFDAVMGGLPLATANLQCMGAFVTEHELGVVFDERDPASIAAAIRSVAAAQPDGVRDVARLARLQEEVSWERQSQVLVEAYHDIKAAEPRRAERPRP